MKRDIKRILTLGLALALVSGTAVLAQSTTEPAWKDFAERIQRDKPGMSEDDMRNLWQFHKANPDLDHRNLVEAWDFHKANPDFGREELGQIWEFHRNNPQIETKEQLGELWRYHKENPGFEREDLAEMWELHTQHGVKKGDLADMWQYKRENPNGSKREFNRAYKQYQKDPESFRARRDKRQMERNDRKGDSDRGRDNNQRRRWRSRRNNG